MKFTLSWLKDHLDTTASLDEIVETLTRIGLEVEDVEDKAKTLAPYTVAYVISAEQHPECRSPARLRRRYGRAARRSRSSAARRMRAPA